MAALIVVDLGGSDLRPEDFLNPGIPIGAVLSRELMLNLFAADTPLHDGAVLVRGNRIESAGVILPLSRDSVSRFGTRHLAALGITERFDRCICIVVSEETGTLMTLFWRTRASWNDRSPVHASRNCCCRGASTRTVQHRSVDRTPPPGTGLRRTSPMCSDFNAVRIALLSCRRPPAIRSALTLSIRHDWTTEEIQTLLELPLMELIMDGNGRMGEIPRLPRVQGIGLLKRENLRLRRRGCPLPHGLDPPRRTGRARGRK